MQDAEFWTKADAEWAAMPGAEPEWWSFRSHHELGDREQAIKVLQEAVALQRADGARHFRLTEADGGVWIAGWSERPRKEAEFNPPVTLSPA